MLNLDKQNFVNEELTKRLQHLGQFSSSPVSAADQTLISTTNIDSISPLESLRSAAEPNDGDKMSIKRSIEEYLPQPRYEMIYAQDGYEEEIPLGDQDGDVTMYHL